MITTTLSASDLATLAATIPTVATLDADYRVSLASLKKAEGDNARAEDRSPILRAKAALAQSEEALVFRMVADVSKAAPSKRDELYATANRARTSAVYWPRMVATALKWASA